MRQTSFRAAEIIPALITLAEQALTGVRIEDGPFTAKPSETDVLTVGWAPDIEQHVVARRVDDEDLNGRVTEIGDIACYIAVRTGDADDAGLTAVRNRAIEILEQLETAIRGDKTRLGGTVDHAKIGTDLGLTQYQTRDGAEIGLPFSVAYEAHI